MRLLPILAAASIGLFAATAVQAEGNPPMGQGNPSGAQNMDTTNRGNPNRPTAGQKTSSGSKASTSGSGMSSKSSSKRKVRKPQSQ